MQLALYSNDSVTSCQQHIVVVHLAVVSGCVGVSCSNGEEGIGEAGVCNNWRCVRNIVSPLVGHLFFRELWVHKASEIHSGSNEMWTSWRISDHSHCVHGICIQIFAWKANQLLTQIVWNVPPNIVNMHVNCMLCKICPLLRAHHNLTYLYTLTNDSKVSETLTVMLPYAAFSHTGFSPCTAHTTKQQPTPLSKVGRKCS